MSDPAYRTLLEQRDGVASGELTATELVDASLARIETLDGDLNAFAHVRTAEARAEAAALDADFAAGRIRGPLHGIPVAIKEENDVAGVITGFGGAANTTPAAADGEVVRLLKQAGAIVVGTTRMPEFGIWPFTESDANGVTRNPWDFSRSPAGSSGGTGAAVAAGIVSAAIGGDGGGSIRLPAAWCGVVGLKPQRGRVSSAPAPDLWRALGTRGPLTRTVADTALVYDVISGTTPVDRFPAPARDGSWEEAAAHDPRPLRILVSSRNPGGGPVADAAVVAGMHATAELLAQLGHEIIEADPRYPKLGLPFQAQLGGGIRDEAAAVEHPDRLEPRTRTMLRLAALLAPWGSWAERRADAVASDYLPELFSRCDVLLTPTVPTTAQPAGELIRLSGLAAAKLASPVASYTSIWNVLGNPAAAVPAGFDSAGLPLSVQLIGPNASEPLLIQLAAQLERARPWTRRPPIG